MEVDPMQFENSSEDINVKAESNEKSNLAAEALSGNYMTEARNISDSSKSTAGNNLPDLKIDGMQGDGGRTQHQSGSKMYEDRVIQCPGVKDADTKHTGDASNVKSEHISGNLQDKRDLDALNDKARIHDNQPVNKAPIVPPIVCGPWVPPVEKPEQRHRDQNQRLR
jgi:hypothetical protein